MAPNPVDPTAIARSFDQRSSQVLARICTRVLNRIDRNRRWSGRLGRILGQLAVPTVVHAGELASSVSIPQVLLVSHDLSSSGAPKIVFEIANILRAKGASVTVLAPHDGPFRTMLTDIGAAVVLNPTALKRPSLAKALAARADLAICNTVVTAKVVRALSPLLPTFWYIHEVSMVEELLELNPELAETFRLPHTVWSGSELSAVLIRPHRTSVQILPYGLEQIASPLSHPAGTKDGRLQISIFGSITRRKGQDLAVEAVNLLSLAERDSIELSLYGQVLDRNFNIIVEAAAAKVPEVHLRGELDPAAYTRAILNCDAVLVSSRDDTLPLVSLDALGAGRVLLCTSTTGTSAYLQPGVNGFISASADAASIAAMLSTAIAQRKEWPAIGRAAQALFVRAFSKNAFATSLMEVIEPVIRQAGKSL